MFESRRTAGFNGNGIAHAGELLDRATLIESSVPRLTADALQQELPRLISRRRDFPATVFPGGQQWSSFRCIDVTVACVAILFFAPLMVLIAIAILATSPGAVFFRQLRLGLGGRTFSCLKFRTMRMDAEAALRDLLLQNAAAKAEWDSTHKLKRDPRASRLGAFLRRTSLDELPQLFNVFAGQMSIVGPRPIVVEEAFRYRRYIHTYYAVKPGITGLWQISGRTQTTYRRRVACDVRYVRTRSIYRDLRIIALTVPVVILGRGAY